MAGVRTEAAVGLHRARVGRCRAERAARASEGEARDWAAEDGEWINKVLAGWREKKEERRRRAEERERKAAAMEQLYMERMHKKRRADKYKKELQHLANYRRYERAVRKVRERQRIEDEIVEWKWSRAYGLVWGREAAKFIKIKKEEQEDDEKLPVGMAQPVY